MIKSRKARASLLWSANAYKSALRSTIWSRILIAGAGDVRFLGPRRIHSGLGQLEAQQFHPGWRRRVVAQIHLALHRQCGWARLWEAGREDMQEL